MGTRPAKSHAGVDLPADHVLFAEPPPQIGEVLSARSTLKQGAPTEATAGERAWRAAWCGFLGHVFGWVLFNFGPSSPIGPLLYRLQETVPTLYLWGHTLIMIGFAVHGWFTAKKSFEVSYVGKDGLAAFGFEDDPRTAKSTLLLKFADATELRTGQTRHYRNNRYQWTTYFYRWSDAAGRTLAEFGGAHHVENGEPEADDAWHFGKAAEIAWANHLLSRAQAELDKTGKLVFKVTGRDWVAVGPGFLELCFGGQPPAKCTKDELEAVTIHRGRFTIKRKDAKVGWFSSTGVFEFPFEDVANARFFLFAVDRIAGLKLGS